MQLKSIKKQLTVSVGIRPRLVEALNAADSAEEMLSLLSVELVTCEKVGSLQQLEVPIRHYKVNVVLYGANTAAVKVCVVSVSFTYIK